jgi:hypothetical protein
MSPEMLKLARDANPDALFFEQGDFRKNMPEWEGAWSLVSCMWCAYNYVDSMKELEQLVENMIRWAKPGGAVFIPVMDMEDIRPNTQIPYEEKADIFGGTIYLTSATWTWIESGTGKIHTHLIAPHVEHFIKLLEPYFDNIEVVRYPPYMTGWVSRKAIVATGRRTEANYNQTAKITWQQIPAPEIASGQSSNGAHSIASSLSHKQLIAELFGRIKSGRLLHSLKRKIFQRNN